MSGYILLRNQTCVPASSSNPQCQIAGTIPGSCALCYSPIQPYLAMSTTYTCQSYQPGLFCPQGCIQCTTNTTCISCSTNYLLNTTSNQCVFNPVMYCNLYSSPNSGICTGCINGFTLVNNTCTQAAYGCSISNCQICDGINLCYVCNTGYVTYNTGQSILCLTPQQIN